MAHAAETLERAEHTSHAGHGGHHHASGNGEGDKLPTRIGITMAVLGVLLAFTASRVGYERAELVQWLVDQEHAHVKYETQDIKHRTAMLTLQLLHSNSDPQKTEKKDALAIANSAHRYLEESKLANAWVHSYDAIVAAHSEAQEEYEHAQLAAELGIVIASIALLLKRRIAWLTAIALGVISIGMTVATWRHAAHMLDGAEAKAEEAEKAYHEARHENKTTEADEALVEEVLKTYAP